MTDKQTDPEVAKRPTATVSSAGDGRFIATVPSGHAQVLTSNGEKYGAASPMELLLIAVGACTAMDVESILEKKREKVTNYRVEVHGDRRAEHPRSYTRIEVRHILRGHNLNAQAVERAIQLSEEKYCSVSATLRPTAEIVSTYVIEEESAE